MTTEAPSSSDAPASAPPTPTACPVLRCATCDYDLRGMSVRSVCPECGTPVVDPDLLAFLASESAVRRFLRATRLARIAVGVGPVGWALVFGVILVNPSQPPLLPLLLALLVVSAAPVLWAIAAHRLTDFGPGRLPARARRLVVPLRVLSAMHVLAAELFVTLLAEVAVPRLPEPSMEVGLPVVIACAWPVWTARNVALMLLVPRLLPFAATRMQRNAGVAPLAIAVVSLLAVWVLCGLALRVRELDESAGMAALVAWLVTTTTTVALLFADLWWLDERVRGLPKPWPVGGRAPPA
jgi:hypothetical protein